MDGKELGGRVRAARKRAGLTAEQMCVELGISWGTLMRWENGKGKRGLTYPQLLAISQITNTPLGEFTGEKATA